MKNSIIKASLYGFAIGDAMGVPIEFITREKLLKNPVTKMLGYGSHDVPEGCWSDDTSMVLATMDSIIKSKGINYNDMADKFCEWINDAKYTPTNELFDLGITTKESLVRYWNESTHKTVGIGRNTLTAIGKYNREKVDATKCGGTSISSNGNGSLMRILPIIYYVYYNNINEEKRLNIIKNVSSITHAHEISIIGCFIYTEYILNLLNGIDKFVAYDNLRKINYKKYFSEETITLYKRIINNDLISLSINDINSSGYVLNTLEAVLWVTLNTENFKDSILKAINLGNDTDTIGALVGGISGILYGYSNIPNEWIKYLKGKPLLDEISTKFEKKLNHEK
ncbi:MAG: ADP-ribosylglycohydrolase family protein [Bacilli bacterium]|nr:ADP-ribosylglycohydrolase family protein [Bacilli bacterium]